MAMRMMAAEAIRISQYRADLPGYPTTTRNLKTRVHRDQVAVTVGVVGDGVGVVGDRFDLAVRTEAVGGLAAFRIRRSAAARPVPSMRWSGGGLGCDRLKG